MSTLLLLLAALCVVLPSGYVAAALPALWLLQNTVLGTDAVLLSAGPVDLTPVDLVLGVLLLKFGVSLATEKQLVAHRPLYAAVGFFLAINLVATLVAGWKFGDSQLLRCLASLARFVSELAIIPIVAQSVKTLPQARRCLAIVLATLLVLAAIQFVNFFGASHGFLIGEVQGAEREELRYFGPMGDSVGVVLLLGYLVSLCFANVPGLLVFLGGILLTAGLGAIFAAGVGTIFFFLFHAHSAPVRVFLRTHVRLLPVLGAGALATLFALSQPLGRTLLDRFSLHTMESSGAQRLTSATFAATMIADNPLLGTGFMGYLPALEHYGGEKVYNLDEPDGAMANANNQFLQALTDAGLLGLLAAATLVFCAARLLLSIATRSEDQFVSTFFLAAFLWLLAQAFGNLAAVWLVPSSYVARFLWILLGTGVAVMRLLSAANSFPAIVPAPADQPEAIAA